MPERKYYAMAFMICDDDSVTSGEAVECASRDAAITKARELFAPLTVDGAVAFSAAGLVAGDFRDCSVLEEFGVVPEDAFSCQGA